VLFYFNSALSTAPEGRYNTCLFSTSRIGTDGERLSMKRKHSFLAVEDDLTVGLTFHEFPASLLTEFAEKIAKPFYRGNITSAIKDLMQQAITEREFVLSHIKYMKSEGNG
jgi:hypothetical protein